MESLFFARTHEPWLRKTFRGTLPEYACSNCTGQNDLLRFPVTRCHQRFHLERPVSFGPLITHADPAPPDKRFSKHKHAPSPATFVFVVDTTCAAFCVRNRLADFLVELDGLFIHAQHRIIAVVRLLIRVQNVFHRRNEPGQRPEECPSFGSSALSFRFFQRLPNGPVAD